MAGNEAGGHSTSQLTDAGMILRTLTPPTVATLDLLINYDVYLQSEIANIIGRKRPTVSRYLQSLEFDDHPFSITRKQGKHYKPTECGEQIFGLIDGMLDRLGSGLQEIVWDGDTQPEIIEDELSPLYDSRSIWPFLILESIRSRVNFFDSLEPVDLEDVILDVRVRQQEMNESVTPTQIRETVDRFDDKGVVEFDGSRIFLEGKGQEHVRLLHQLVQILENEVEYDQDGGVHQSTLTSSSNSESSRIAHQLDPRPFRGGSRTVSASRRADQTTSVGVQDPLTIVPAYYLIPSDETETDEGGADSPVFPFTSLTVRELADYASQLDQKYDDDALLKPYWALRTGAGLSPLGPAQFGSLGETE